LNSAACPQSLMLFKFIGKSLLAIAAVAAIVIFCYYSDINSPISSSGTPEKFTVAPGENIKEIGRGLQKAGLIKSEFHFKAYIWQTKNSAKIQAGIYQLSQRMTIKDIVAALSAGKIINEEKEITIIPGWDLRDIYKYLQAQPITSSTAFYQLSGEPEKKYASGKLPDFSQDFSVLADKPKSYGLEGYLFPDTYRIFNQATARDVIEKMLSNLDAKFTPAMRTDVTRQNRTIYQVITLASIIEKEVRETEDMKIVSGVFTNRLAIGQTLGSDATLSYILGDNNAAHSIEQTKIDSPYNTYRYAGLPPGPICNPSLDAIIAAIYPAPTDYYFFLTDPKSGQTIFSKTLAEHNRNKAKYLR
jgi:UPF0755 protein